MFLHYILYVWRVITWSTYRITYDIQGLWGGISTWINTFSNIAWNGAGCMSYNLSINNYVGDILFWMTWQYFIIFTRQHMRFGCIISDIPYICYVQELLSAQINNMNVIVTSKRNLIWIIDNNCYHLFNNLKQNLTSIRRSTYFFY